MSRPPVFIRTFERPRLLRALLADLDREGATDVFVLDDASSADMAEPRAYCEERRWRYRRAQKNHGKKRAWQLWNEMFEEAQRLDAKLFVFLDDDMRLCHDFFRLLDEHWSSIESDSAATLMLMVDSREQRTCWTGMHPRRQGTVVRTQWVDGAFAIHRRALHAVGWKIKKIPPGRWGSTPNASTGVGRQLSQRLHRANYGMFRVCDSLVDHVGKRSKMNPAERRSHPLRARRFLGRSGRGKNVDRVEASLASIRKRAGSLRKVVDRLAPQVSVLRVYLNGYRSIPSWLRRDNVVVARSQDHGDRGDAGKFFWSDQADGYQLTCDDDMLYPKNYVERMIDVLERFDRQAVVGVHGVRFVKTLTTYYRSRQVVHFTKGTSEHRCVHLVGTGTLAYHPETIRVTPDDFEAPNMADIWFGLLCQQQRVPVYAIKRSGSWLKPLPASGSIYDRHKRRDTVQTEAVRRCWPWQLYEVKR